jgi:hypothetical protein
VGESSRSRVRSREKERERLKFSRDLTEKEFFNKEMLMHIKEKLQIIFGEFCGFSKNVCMAF